jgi:uncharacterized protein
VRRLHNGFAAWAALMWDWHRWVGVGCLVLLVICPILMRGLEFETLSGSPLNSATAGDRYRDAVARFGEGSPLVVVLTHSNANARAFDAFTDALAVELQGWEEILAVEYRTWQSERSEALAWQLSVALANAGGSTLSELSSRLSASGMQEQIESTRQRLLAARGMVQQSRTAADPLNIGELVLPFYRSRVSAEAFAQTAYMDSSDGQSRLVLVRPSRPAADAPYAISLIARIKDAADSLREKTGAGGVEVAFTGTYGLTADGAALLQVEIRWITLGAVVALFLLLALVFRNLRASLLCALPVVISMVSVLIVVCLVFNPVGLIAMGFAAIILGLSIDVTIHCAGSLFQKLDHTDSVRDATIETFRECAPPILVGVTTTAAAFFCMVFASFAGLRQFGLLAASGLLVSLVSTFVVFPAAVRWLYGRKAPSATLLSYHLMPRRLFVLSYANPRLALSLAGGVAVLSILSALGFRFDMAPDSSLPQSLPAVKTAITMAERHGTALLMSARVTISAPTLNCAMSAQKQLDRFLMGCVEDGSVAAFESPSMMMHYPQLDSAVIGELVQRVEQGRLPFSELSSGNAEPSPRAVAYYEALASAIHMLDVDTQWPATSAITLARLQRHAVRDGNGVYLQTYVWPPGGTEAMAAVKQIAERVQTIPLADDASLTASSTYQAYEELNTIIRRDFVRVSMIGICVVALMVFLYFRDVLSVLLALAPVVASICFTFAMLRLTHRPFSPSGIGLVAMLIGIGIDDAVHILTRVHGCGDTNLSAMLQQIGPVLAMTSISTMIGFGVLLASQFTALSSLGFAVVIGVAACLVFTLAVVPACLALRSGSRESRATGS